MRDRRPTRPGRVHMEPIPGEAGSYIMTMADEPYEGFEGTEWNKANVLTDATVEGLGLNPEDDPTPDEAFSSIATSLASKVTKTTGMTKLEIISHHPSIDIEDTDVSFFVEGSLFYLHIMVRVPQGQTIQANDTLLTFNFPAFYTYERRNGVTAITSGSPGGARATTQIRCGGPSGQARYIFDGNNITAGSGGAGFEAVLIDSILDV